MLDVSSTIESYYQDEFTALTSWCNDMHQQCFQGVDAQIFEIYQRMQDSDRVISDAELEWVIVSLPIELIRIAEALNELRLQHAVVKLKQKAIKAELKSVSPADADSQMVEHKIVEAAYQSVISRVENEIAFCKELIMGAKKLFDSRRSAESVVPISEVDLDLPAYEPKRSTYIR